MKLCCTRSDSLSAIMLSNLLDTDTDDALLACLSDNVLAIFRYRLYDFLSLRQTGEGSGWRGVVREEEVDSVRLS